MQMTVSVSGLDELGDLLRQIDFDTLSKNVLPGLAMELESQTKRRITEEKQAADGTPWPDWSDEYASSRGPQHSLLQNEGHLNESITSFVSGGQAGVGSNLVYAATHQFGRADIPARPFLGISRSNETDLVAVVTDFLGGGSWL